MIRRMKNQNKMGNIREGWKVIMWGKLRIWTYQLFHESISSGFPLFLRKKKIGGAERSPHPPETLTCKCIFEVWCRRPQSPIPGLYLHNIISTITFSYNGKISQLMVNLIFPIVYLLTFWATNVWSDIWE